MKINIVGAGLAAATSAAILKEKGFRNINVFESRPHIAGNCYDSNIKGIKVHNYGPHGFHTNDKWVWDFVNKYDKFNNRKLQVTSRLQDGKFINIPFNRLTKDKVGDWDSDRIIQEIFIPYSEKHWGCSWDELPKSITSRVPTIRDDDCLDYHLDKFQGIPSSGYTELINNMFEGCNVYLGCKEDEWKKHKADLLIYTGSIDSYYDYEHGALSYRSLRFEYFEDTVKDFHQLNECNYDNKWTRTIDHSHWYESSVSKTVLSREYSEEYSSTNPVSDRFYPKPFESNEIYKKYKSIPTNTIFLGRLGTYKYLDMDDCIKQAFKFLNEAI